MFSKALFSVEDIQEEEKRNLGISAKGKGVVRDRFADIELRPRSELKTMHNS